MRILTRLVTLALLAALLVAVAPSRPAAAVECFPLDFPDPELVLDGSVYYAMARATPSVMCR